MPPYAQGAASCAYDLTRDVAGRITAKTERSEDGTHTWTYAYDALGRLIRANRDGSLAESYAYDASGNRTAVRAPLRGIESTVALAFGADDRVLTAGDATYTLTADGFLAAKRSAEGTTTYAYSALGELTRIDLPDGREVTYTYDASGRRVAKAVDGAITQRYEWADATHLLAIYDAAGQRTARFTYADGRVPMSVETTSGTYRPAYDQVGSLRAVLSADGHVAREIAYDSFGCVISDTNPALAIPLGFAGGLADTDTGLTLFGARDYDPVLGRWCAKDPIGFAGGDANLYGYCLGDPVGLVDRDGLTVEPGDIPGTEDWDGITSATPYHTVATVSAAWLQGAKAINGCLIVGYTIETIQGLPDALSPGRGGDRFLSEYYDLPGARGRHTYHRERTLFIEENRVRGIGAGPSAVPGSVSVSWGEGHIEKGLEGTASAYGGGGMSVSTRSDEADYGLGSPQVSAGGMGWY